MRREKTFFFLIFLSFLLIFIFSSVGSYTYCEEVNDEETEEETPTRQVTPMGEDEEDPFDPLFEDPEDKRREPGLLGMSIAELKLLGITKVRGEYWAYVRGIDDKPYRLEVDQQLRDGYVQRIGENEVVYMQKVDDPVVQDKYTPIIKRLHEEDR